ncbi:MAG: TerB family tellurite resistance protein [Armatimonadetes bacterium]|nr:TerB family tellurite resistance protein [Armatimonadota bacterium]
MNPHLSDYNESERADYMTVVAFMAGMDDELTSEEVLALQELSHHFVLGPLARGRVMAATAMPREELDTVVARLAGSGTRFSLLLDLCAMAYRDGHFSPAEKAEIERLGERIGIQPDQIAAVLQFAEVVHEPQPADLDKALAELEKAGVPRPAVALSATLYGLVRAGKAPGLEALLPVR